MKRILLGLLTVVVLAVLAAGLFVLSARQGLLTPSDTVLRARYTLPNSKFTEIAGEPIHYVDEGVGDPIVLIHGSVASLREWDDWAAALKGRYRVIRYDEPPMGLSGPAPDGGYGVTQNLAIIQRLTAKLGVSRFFLVATSSGGEVGAAYAAEHPEQIKGLILANIAVGPFKMNTSDFKPSFKALLAVESLFNGWHSQIFWRAILHRSFADPRKVTPALVAQWTDLNNRTQREPADFKAFPPTPHFARTPGDLARITAPTLLLWSAEDEELPVKAYGELGLQRLGSKDKSLQIVPNCGHIMPIECGPESAAVAGAFFDRIEADGRAKSAGGVGDH